MERQKEEFEEARKALLSDYTNEMERRDKLLGEQSTANKSARKTYEEEVRSKYPTQTKARRIKESNNKIKEIDIWKIFGDDWAAQLSNAASAAAISGKGIFTLPLPPTSPSPSSTIPYPLLPSLTPSP